MNKLFLNSLKERLAKIFKSRIFYVGLGITVAMTAISARLYYLQIVQESSTRTTPPLSTRSFCTPKLQEVTYMTEMAFCWPQTGLHTRCRW